MRDRTLLLLVVGIASAVGACAAPEPDPAPADPAAEPSPAAASGPSPSHARRGEQAPPLHVPAPSPEPTPAPALPPVGAVPGHAIPAFQAKVRRSEGGAVREETLDSRGTKGTTVYVMNSGFCSYCNVYASRMRDMEEAYLPKGVDVVHVYPSKHEPEEEKVAWHAKMGFRGGQLLDGDASIARGLKVKKTPTIFVVDSRGVILYRGAIDSSAAEPRGAKPYLADALDAVLAGRAVPLAETEPEG